MKVRRTVGDEKTTFTTLLRGLSPLGDALGCTTYDDSGARLVFGKERWRRASSGRGKVWQRTWHNVAGGRVEPQPNNGEGFNEYRFSTPTLSDSEESEEISRIGTGRDCRDRRTGGLDGRASIGGESVGEPRPVCE